jgi:micrococcal nuclease
MSQRICRVKLVAKGQGLAYVYLEDGTFVNAEIIRQGYGLAYTRFPFKHLEEFRRLEREARESKRGLWGP